MSDEYRFKASAPAEALAALAEELTNLGMSGDARGAFSWPDAHPSVADYGGNVRLLLEVDAVFMTLNVPAPARFAESLRLALIARSLDVELEEA